MENEQKKFYVTTPIFYVNDKPHIGSAYPAIAADVLARLHRQLGEEVFFQTGTDEHGAKIEAAAKKAGKAPKEFADTVAAQFSLAFDQLGIAPDKFIRTTDPEHEAAVEIFLHQLKASGKIYEGEYEGLYCVGHEAYIKESELVNGLCPDHKTKPEKLKEKNWFFKLSDYQKQLVELIDSDQLEIRPFSRKNEVLSFIKQGLEDIAISRPNVKWGIPIPWDKNQTVYVWVEALFNYCSGVGFGSDPENFAKFWPADLHIVGKDIIKFHCIIWPALLLAIGLDTPKRVFAHGFFTINGEKMSKSLDNAIDPNDWVAKYGSEAVRYFMLREIPFGADGDVSEEKLKARFNGDLANGLGNLFSRTTNMIEKYLDGHIEEFVASPKDLSAASDAFYNSDFAGGLIRIWEEIAWANQLIDKAKPWELVKEHPDKVKELLLNLAALLYDIALKLAPVLPETAQKIKAVLESGDIKKPEPLFQKIE
ncbi:MAG: methionine--tRNA ligase [Candidatus Doudnabacteria bacterium RIFCSPHIGHO2_02_FULL_42_25]|uniref:Methionine--tRNA ligase n=1 Tax=Candidatus Doudnabacteria bacterium RIFCSPHIGHO2_01_FULL_41_86 TaxID=1817821 RepID=A0A1F5N9N2_9BACT|nr:MAG: methionine--tRNA ligase [Candidatus Doudnabacteria bacterium RIFCSPHIGHO2_01_FULL_41_86]OGE75092.1 MAG: methionine--tRNA ligase [Candidatus Doudnabacteria bacterium RIFCSPHIGHO2_01_43_10]OGE85322.1 MAG: methionine--tRNA ligase [Candidatus Doudnabacteria bacterium RIFCSPHIGHO2_12_FULL_42_22]OGE86860.1 MAG: methionine--tRNA ligase [Candidatus Doudnabacteria bacterium RIFCSPHIGHO2_02_FULL_42_25]OGE92459.1 MAG: methionine--tRNA ligase [Candidatus Doudnabacteria bacterium RIFCSPLOWO2_01_FULL